MKPPQHSVSGSDLPRSANTQSFATPRDRQLTAWLEAHAERLDSGRDLAQAVLPMLGNAGLLHIGVPEALGGAGGDIAHAIEAIAGVAESSMTAALVFWSQRALIECLLHSDNHALRDGWLPALLNGKMAGAVGLSNAMKYLAKMESLHVTATDARQDGGSPVRRLSGTLPFVTNLHADGYVTAIAAAHSDGTPPSIYAVAHDARGVQRSADLDLIALRASNTAALTLNRMPVDERHMIASNAVSFIASVRPNFLGLQCGLSIGLARRSLRSLHHASESVRATLGADGQAWVSALEDRVVELFDGLASSALHDIPAALFNLRLQFATLVESAVALEVQAAGSRGFMHGSSEVARRRREASFIPVLTPSVVQLRQILLAASGHATLRHRSQA